MIDREHTVAYWTFAVPAGAALPERTGRYSGAATGVSASSDGKAWVFPGGQAHVRVPNADALHLEGAFTIEAVIRPARLGSSTNNLGVQGIVEKHIAPGGYLLVLDKDGRLEYWLETAAGQTKDSSTLAVPIDGRFHHVAMTWDGRTVRLWVDGNAAGEHAFAGPLGRCVQDLYLGNDDTLGWSYEGEIREIRLSNVALAPEAFLRVQ